MKKLWVTEAGMSYDPVTKIYTDLESGKIYDAEKMEWVHPKKPKVPKVEKEGIIKTSTKRKKAEWFEAEETQLSSVYVSNLPKTITIDKFVKLMQKCGLLKQCEKTEKPKVKLYTDNEGKFKGDGLAHYLAPESVDLALQILDEQDVEGNKIKVELAKFEMKGKFDKTKKKKGMNKKEKIAAKKTKNKLLGWGGMGITTGSEDPKTKRARYEKVVVFSNCFTVDEVARDPTIILQVKDALRAACSGFGAPRKVNMFDGHPNGICSVAFNSAEDADRAIDGLDKRLLRGRTLSAKRWDGVTDYTIEETQAEIENRDSAWKEWLEDDDEEETDY